MPQNRAVFAALDHQHARTHVDEFWPRLSADCFARKHARFGIVDQQEIPFRDGLQQFIAEIGDPVIHGVAADQLLRRRSSAL